MNANSTRQRSIWARTLGAVASVVSATALALGTPAIAHADPVAPSGQQTTEGASCETFPGGATVETETADLDRPYGRYRGYATWHAYGDWLSVKDLKSNGLRIVALLSYCVNGHWHANLWRDSGPNEGSSDYEDYHFDFAEGRGIRLQVCELKRSTGHLYHCGAIHYTHS